MIYKCAVVTDGGYLFAAITVRSRTSVIVEQKLQYRITVSLSDPAHDRQTTANGR